MTTRKNLKVDPDAFDAADEQKPPEVTWSDVAVAGAIVYAKLMKLNVAQPETLLNAGVACLTGEGIEDYAPRDYSPDTNTVDPEPIADAVAERLDGETVTMDDLDMVRISDSLTAIEERTGRLEKTLEDLQR